MNPVFLFPVFLFPAAGESRRFRDAGHSAPKPVLRIRWLGRTRRMIEYAMDAVPPGHRISVALPESVPLASLDRGCEIHRVHRTESHADTVSQMLSFWLSTGDAPVVVMDCDVILPRHVVEVAVERLYYGTPVVVCGATAGAGFSSADHSPWAYALREATGGPTPLPVVGLRAYPSGALLRQALRGSRTMTEATNKLAPPYRVVIASSWTDWGTPEAVAASGAEIAS